MENFIQNPVYVFAILNLSIFLMELISKRAVFKYLGTALLVIIVGAILSNSGLIPSASNSIPLYSGIFDYLAPLSVFYLLLEVNLKSLKNAGLPMLTMFFLGAFGTACGALLGIYFIDGKEAFGDSYQAVAGMFTGTYIGGSVNFNALAIHYNMLEKGNIYAGAVAVDNIITTVWMIACIALPKFFNKLFKRKTQIQAMPLDKSVDVAQSDDTVAINTKSIGILLFLGAATLFVSDLITLGFSNLGIEMPSIIIVTTIALILAQIKAIHQIKGSRFLGLYSVYLFLIVIGAYCELSALASIGVIAINLMIFACILVIVHAIVLFGIGAITKIDWELISIASQANIGGSSTALALAKSLNRNDLLLPGILVGALGNGVGTYIAFIIASII